MTALRTSTGIYAKPGTDDCVGQSRRGLRLNTFVMQKSRDVFPVKTAHHLADVTGYSVRAAERWLSEKVVIPSDALASLIQSEWGREYLAAVMTDSTPRWWLIFKAHLKRISFEAAEALQARKYKELLNEEADARKYHATPLYQDDPYYEGLASPPRSPSRRKTR
jgi:hypothetical protein